MGMRDFLIHRYFDTDHAVVTHVVEHELGPLRRAVEELQEQLRRESSTETASGIDRPDEVDPPANDPPVDS